MLSARERAMEDWLIQQALPSHDAYRADRSTGIPLDEVRANIGRRRG